MGQAGAMQPDTVIFDIGRVVINWVPEHAFEPIMPAAEIPAFMERIGFAQWNHRNDALASIAGSEDDLVAAHPADEIGIRAYRTNFLRTIEHAVPGTTAIIAELARAGVRVSALTNWAADMFAITRERFDVMKRFADIVVSGAEGIVKPDTAIYLLACERLGIEPGQAVFVDDTPANAAAATAAGLTGLHFTSADALRVDLVGLGLLGPRQDVAGPLYHWALRRDWEEAVATGEYGWSTRGLAFERAGFVHCSFAGQVAATRSAIYSDVAEGDLVLLGFDPAGLPVVVEDGGDGEEFPHLYAPLPLARAVVQRSFPE